jgi:D-aspartate ligase
VASLAGGTVSCSLSRDTARKLFEPARSRGRLTVVGFARPAEFVEDVYRDRPTAVVMNLFYTGLGIARSLGERGVRVIGLTAHRDAPGNCSRYLRAHRCADSVASPELLLDQMVALGRQIGHRSVLFPTRDGDLVFLDRFRGQLEPYFRMVIPTHEALDVCLDKWKTVRAAAHAGVASPKTWVVHSEADLARLEAEIAYPCVIKPVAAHHWRGVRNWQLVGARKAVGAMSSEELHSEYTSVARANASVLIQECIPGGDDALVVAACYVDRQFRFQAGFNIQKLVQTPAGFGTGCIVQTTHHPELIERSAGLLRAMNFSGIAEVEYKRDPRDGQYKLIEVNPRPWDQHRLGAACGVDLMYLAYCDHAGLPLPTTTRTPESYKWIAEDTFLLAALRLCWRRERGVAALFRNARGRRVYGVWSARDPLPFLAFAVMFGLSLATDAVRALARAFAAFVSTRHKAEVRATQ